MIHCAAVFGTPIVGLLRHICTGSPVFSFSPRWDLPPPAPSGRPPTPFCFSVATGWVFPCSPDRFDVSCHPFLRLPSILWASPNYPWKGTIFAHTNHVPRDLHLKNGTRFLLLFQVFSFSHQGLGPIGLAVRCSTFRVPPCTPFGEF